MKLFACLGLVLMFGVAACGEAPIKTAASTAPQTGDAVQPERSGGHLVMREQYDVQAVNVTVPRSLKVSEANSYRPIADIVWRGDPPGDRYAQVKAIFDDAMARGTAMMHQGPKVVVEVEVIRFHAVTERTRYSIGGVHSMRFMLTVRDAASGAILQGPREVVADVKAAGGAKALAEDAAGRTQKVVVTERLAKAIRQELSTPVTGEQAAMALAAQAAVSPDVLDSPPPVQ